jgi:hypothetical protein
MKYIAIFLLLANLGYFFWSNSKFAEPVTFASPPVRPLLNNGMTLLDEFQAQRASRLAAEALQTKVCLRVGPFNNSEDAAAFISQAREFELSTELVFEGERLPSQYRVYLPPASSRAIAAIVLDALGEAAESAGLQLETYLITRGNLENAIALGVFESPEQAAEIEGKVKELGYEPKIEEIIRSDRGVVVWLEGPNSLTLEASEWLVLAQESPELLASENLCETIAQGEQFP